MIAIIYVVQGMLYFTTLVVLPAYFAAFPEIVPIPTQNFFLVLVKSAVAVKIAYGAIIDKISKIQIKNILNKVNLAIISLGFILTAILWMVTHSPITFIFVSAFIFYIVAFFDTYVDTISVLYSKHESRIGIVAFMNIAYSFGLIVSNSVYLTVPMESQEAWLKFISIMVLISMQLLLGLFAIQYVILKATGESHQADLKKNPENSESTEITDKYDEIKIKENLDDKTEEIVKFKEDLTENYKNSDKAEQTELISGTIEKDKYNKIALYLVILLFLANIDELVSVTFNKWVVESFGIGGFTTMVDFSAKIGLPVKIGVLVLLYLLREKISGKEFKLLYFCLISTFLFWGLLPFSGLDFFLFLYFISHVTGAIMLVAMLGVMMQLTPKKRAGSGYQFFSFCYHMSSVLLPVLGNSLYIYTGHTALFIFICVTIIGLIFPLVRKVHRIYDGIETD